VTVVALDVVVTVALAVVVAVTVVVVAVAAVVVDVGAAVVVADGVAVVDVVVAVGVDVVTVVVVFEAVSAVLLLADVSAPGPRGGAPRAAQSEKRPGACPPDASEPPPARRGLRPISGGACQLDQRAPPGTPIQREPPEQ